MSTLSRRLPFIALLATISLLSAPVVARSASAAMQHPTLVLDWNPNSDHAGMYVAMKQGILQRHGIDLQIKVPAGTTSQLQLVAAGRADFGVSYETDLLAARAHGVPVRSVMCIMQHPLDTVMTLRSSGITRPRQLAGHTVGMAGSPSDQPIVSAMMAHDGSSISRVHMQNVGYSLLPALLSKKVDAVVGVYWTWEAIQARQRGFPVNVMRVERWGVPNYCELVLVASDKTIQQRSALVRNVVQSLQQGYRNAEADPALAWRSLLSADPTFRRPRNHQLIVQSVRLLRGAVLGARTIGYESPGQWSTYANWLWSHKLIDGKVNSSAAFTNQFLKQNVS